MSKESKDLLEKIQNIDVTEEYMKKLKIGLPKDKRVVKAYLIAAKKLASEVCDSDTYSSEAFVKMITDIYSMLRQQESVRMTNEYHAMVAELSQQNKNVAVATSPVIKESDKEKFGAN